jgi:hypothetical protein
MVPKNLSSAILSPLSGGWRSGLRIERTLDARGEGARDTGGGCNLVLGGRRKHWDTAETFQKRSATARPDAFYVIERGASVSFRAEPSVIGYREAMGFIADLLQQMKRSRTGPKQYGIFPMRNVYLVGFAY